MRYITPKITRTFVAQTTIQGQKVGPNQEIDLELTPSAAYEADE